MSTPKNGADDGKHRQSSSSIYGDSPDAAYSRAGTRDPSFPTNQGTHQGAGSGAVDYCREQRAARAIPYAGVRAGEIVGHRAWWIMPDGPLSSLAHYREWTPGETVEGDLNAVCIPGGGNNSTVFGGIYAWNCISKMVLQMSWASRITWPELMTLGVYPRVVCGIVFGTVLMWGEVVEHEAGWRAQYAKIASLDALRGRADLSRLRRAYGV